jgi:hypothetical protein
MKVTENKIDKLGNDLGDKIQHWVQTETTFNFLRHTTGRVVLGFLTVILLYGVAFYAWFDRGPIVTMYPVILTVVTLLQKISVRYAFDDDSNIDELQHNRRNRAYRRAYKRIGLILIGLLTLWVGWQFHLQSERRRVQFPGAPFKIYEFHFQADIGSERFVVLVTFIVSLFILQKYLSWGLKGEPKN